MLHKCLVDYGHHPRQGAEHGTKHDTPISQFPHHKATVRTETAHDRRTEQTQELSDFSWTKHIADLTFSIF